MSVTDAESKKRRHALPPIHDFNSKRPLDFIEGSQKMKKMIVIKFISISLTS